jgi:hypothetical protein
VRCDVSVATILELGSHEGSHSLQLAERRGVTRVLGPWLLIAGLASITRYLFLDTHYAASDEVALGAYRGRWQLDGSDALSGLSRLSFWLSFKHLAMLLLEQGFVIRFAHDHMTVNGPRVWLLAEQVGVARAGSVCS